MWTSNSEMDSRRLNGFECASAIHGLTRIWISTGMMEPGNLRRREWVRFPRDDLQRFRRLEVPAALERHDHVAQRGRLRAVPPPVIKTISSDRVRARARYPVRTTD